MTTSPAPDVSSPKHVRLAIVVLVGTALLWSFNGVLIKLLNADGHGLPAATIASLRSLIGGLVLIPWAWPNRHTLRQVALPWRLGVVACFTAMTATFVFATTMTAAANAIILQYTAPVWVFVLSPLVLRERAQLREGLVLLIAMAGVLVIFLGNPSGDLPALGVGLGSGVTFGCLLVLLRRLRKVDPRVMTCLNVLGSGLVLALFSPWTGLAISPRELGLLLLLGFVQFALPYVLFSWAVQHIAAQAASLILLLEAVLNPLWTYLLVGEAVPAATLIGGPLVLLGVAARLGLDWRQSRRVT